MGELYLEIFASFFRLIPIAVVGLGCTAGWILCVIAWKKQWYFKWLFFAFFFLMPTYRIYAIPGDPSRHDLNLIGCFHIVAVCAMLGFVYKLYRETCRQKSGMSHPRDCPTP